MYSYKIQSLHRWTLHHFTYEDPLYFKYILQSRKNQCREYYQNKDRFAIKTIFTLNLLYRTSLTPNSNQEHTWRRSETHPPSQVETPQSQNASILNKVFKRLGNAMLSMFAKMEARNRKTMTSRKAILYRWTPCWPPWTKLTLNLNKSYIYINK